MSLAFDKFPEDEVSPRGGFAPVEKIAQALAVPNASKIAKLETLLSFQWEHPEDLSLTLMIWDLVGFEPTIEEVRSGADYVHSIQSGETVCESEQRAYVKLIAALEKPHARVGYDRP